METKSIDQYFEKARSIPVAMSFEEVQALVKIKGGVPTKHQSWWKTKNFIFMTTAAIITTTALLFFGSPEETEQNITVATIEETKENSKQELTKKQLKEESVVKENEEQNHPETTEENKTTVLQNTVSVLQKEASVLELKKELETSEANKESDVLQEQPELVNAYTVVKSDETGEDVKKITKEVSASGIDLVVVSSYNGDITIETWDKPTVKMDAFVEISGGTKEDISKALEDFDLDLIAKGSKIEIENEWSKHHDCNCSETTIKGKITTKKGDKIRVKKYDIDYVITVPKAINLELKDSYGDITVKDIAGDVKATNFQGDITMGNVGGKLNLNQKYGDVKVGNFSGGDVVLFHSKTDLGSTDKLDLSAKYSEVDIVGVKDLKLKGFQSDVNVAEGMEEARGSLKYGDLLVDGDVKRVDLEVFQAKVDVREVIDFEVRGTYSNFKAKSVDKLQVPSSFQNSYRIGRVNTIKGDAKYTSFDIGVLKEEMDLTTFQGSIDIDEVLSSFSRLDIDTKYTPVDLYFSPEAKFNISAETSYTSVNYPEKSMKINMEDKQQHKNNFKGVFNADNTKEPSLVNVVSFQGKINLR